MAPAGRKEELGHTPEGTALIGRQVGGFTVEKVLGRGSMGWAYLARSGRQKVVLKMLRAIEFEAASKEAVFRRFRREAQSLQKLVHPHIVQLLDWDLSERNSAYIAMEYVRGITLDSFLEKHPKGVPIFLFLTLMKQFCDAIDAIHHHGIVHRDLNLSNVMIVKSKGSYHIKILDFGLVRLEHTLSQGPDLTQKGDVFGTPAYMSPEQCLGETVTYQSDIYSLGVISYELLSGEMPFGGENLKDLFKKQIHSQPLPLDRHRPEIPGAIAAAIEKAMSKKPEKRFQSGLCYWNAICGDENRSLDDTNPIERAIDLGQKRFLHSKKNR